MAKSTEISMVNAGQMPPPTSSADIPNPDINPSTGMSATSVPLVTPVVAPVVKPVVVTPPVTTTTTTPTSTFQPNFNSSTNGGNPYAGVDANYVTTVAQVFVPTTSTPLNPVQTAAIAGQLPTNLSTHPAVINLTPAQQNIIGVTKLTDTPQAIAAKFNPTIPVTTIGSSIASTVSTNVIKPPPITVISGVALTGNIMTDLDALKTANAKPADYITLLNNHPDFNWNNISVQQQQLLAPIVTTFNSNIGNYISIGGNVISKDDYSKLSPQAQLDMMISAGLIDSNAKLAVDVNGNPKLDSKGNWQYTTGKVTTTTDVTAQDNGQYMPTSSIN